MGRRPAAPRWGAAIAGWELIRLARRRSTPASRVLVGLLLFAALCVTYLAAFPQELDRLPPGLVHARLSDFGQDFALTFLFVQTGVVLLLTPLFVAGAVVEETERRTLEFLLATDLSAREIILGKLWPRLLLLVGVVMAGWPVLAATQVWGGVDILFVGLASLLVLGTVWAVAGISLACAVGAPTLRRALGKSYGWSFLCLGLPVFTCPLAVIATLVDFNVVFSRYGSAGPPAGQAGPVFALRELGYVAAHLGIYLLIGGWGIRRACRKLRDVRVLDVRRPTAARPRQQHWEKHPPVPDDSPLVWKEVHLTGQASRFVRLLGLVPWWLWLAVSVVFLVVGLALVLATGGADDVYATMNEMVRWGGGVFVGLMALVVGLHAAGTVARERQQETLDDLLTLPRARPEILRAKWLGSLARARGIALGALAIPIVGALAEGISYWAIVPVLLSAGVTIACAASFGLWVSVRTRTVQRASGVWLLVVTVWVGGTFLAAQAAYIEQRAFYRLIATNFASPAPEPLVWDRVLNPVLAWSELCFRVRDEHWTGYYYGDFQPDGEVRAVAEVWPALLGVMVYGALAWGFYRAAAVRFEQVSA